MARTDKGMGMGSMFLENGGGGGVGKKGGLSGFSQRQSSTTNVNSCPIATVVNQHNELELDNTL